jgi:hypothetical protein
MLSRSHPIILFIDRFGFSVYQDTLTNIPKFNFTPDIVANLDVVNKEQFATLIATFIQINKIISSSLAVILSDDIIYVRDLATSAQKIIPAQGLKIDIDDKEHKDDVQNFLENIPFEEVLAKVIKTGNINRIVAVNKDLVMTIIDAFTSKGSLLEAIMPNFMYGQSANFTAGLTLDNIRVILENAEILKLGNLLTDQEKIVSPQNLENELKNSPTDIKTDLSNGAKKPQNFRQYTLISVFVTLLVVLVVVYLNLGVSKTSPKSSRIKSVPVNTVMTPTATLPSNSPTTTQTLITTVPVNLKNIRVTITQNSQADEKAVNLKSELLKIGLQDIVDEVSEASIPEKSSVMFSQDIPMDLRNNIIAEIKKILPDITILETQDSILTIKVLIGKS